MHGILPENESDHRRSKRINFQKFNHYILKALKYSVHSSQRLRSIILRTTMYTDTETNAKKKRENIIQNSSHVLPNKNIL